MSARTLARTAERLLILAVRVPNIDHKRIIIDAVAEILGSAMAVGRAEFPPDPRDVTPEMHAEALDTVRGIAALLESQRAVARVVEQELRFRATLPPSRGGLPS